jgi:hypothetical protein
MRKVDNGALIEAYRYSAMLPEEQRGYYYSEKMEEESKKE